jgi:hypothetical protein
LDSPSPRRARGTGGEDLTPAADLVSGRHIRDFPQSAREVVLALAGCNVAAITPIEAINMLFSLQQRAAACLAELDA